MYLLFIVYIFISDMFYYDCVCMLPIDAFFNMVLINNLKKSTKICSKAPSITCFSCFIVKKL